jgi:hypothetical protein
MHIIEVIEKFQGCQGIVALLGGQRMGKWVFQTPPPPLIFFVIEEKKNSIPTYIVFSSFHDACHTPSSLPRSLIPPYPLPTFFKREKKDKKKKNNIATSLFDRT